MPAISSLLIGGAVAGGLGGLLSGAMGTPDEVVKKEETSTSGTTLAPMSSQQRSLQEQSLQQYLQSLQQMGAYEQGIGGAQGFQDQARMAAQGVLGGGAFQATPEEMANIQSLRGGMVSQGEADVNRLLDQRLQQLQGSAANRGVRGQALSQLQGDALRAAAQEQGDISRQADLFAAQQAISLPYQRVGAQQPLMSQGLSFADSMRLQAAQNRQTAQSPYLLGLLGQERLATGTTTTSGSGTAVTPGTPGSLGGAIVGALGGAGGGLNVAGNVASGVGNLKKAGASTLW